MENKPNYGSAKPDHRVIRILNLSSAERSWYEPVSQEGYTGILATRSFVPPRTKVPEPEVKVPANRYPIIVACRHFSQRFHQGLKDKMSEALQL
jgi:hypothetical protein